MMQKLLLSTLAVTAVAACGESLPELANSEMHIVTVPVGSTCAELGYGTETYTITNPVDGDYAVDTANHLTFRYYDESNTIFYFTNSSLRMNAVMVTSAGTTAVWELPGATGWPSLHGAIDPTTNTLATPTSVSFCYDYELFLNPNAYAHYGIGHGWSISKTGISAPLLLSADQIYFAQYSVTLTPTTTTEAGLLVEGPVFIRNPNPKTPRIDGVTVLIGDLYATVTCPVTFPYVMPEFSTLTCEFRLAVPDTTDRLVYVDVTSDGSLQVDRSLETVSFSDHTTSIEHYDECVAIYDDMIGYADDFVDTACIWEGPKTITYTARIGPYAACGAFEVVNTAWYEGLDTGATGSSQWTVEGEVPCNLGCTLTPGYWKTHSAFGPAPYDDTWALIGGATTTFFLSGGSYYQALWTPPGGNAYWTLARAYIAAQLNQLNGASMTAVQSTFTSATALLQTTTPAQVASTRSIRNNFVRMAAILDDYNNGLTGPGHCSE